MNELERHLLSRSYESREQIEELLDSRYSATGSQKPTIIFGGLLAEPETSPDEHHENPKTSRKRSKTTRDSVKRYITKTLGAQRRLCQKIGSEPVTQDLLKKNKIPMFEEFIPINQLWQSYSLNLIDNGTNSSTMTGFQRLASADYHGCLLSVTKATNPQLVGVRGIVVWDSQHSFVLVVPHGAEAKPWSQEKQSRSERVGGLRMIPKKGTIFEFDILHNVDSYRFMINGSRFEVRSVERSGKKFKAHSVDSL